MDEREEILKKDRERQRKKRSTAGKAGERA